jgi:hypothetical protein
MNQKGIQNKIDVNNGNFITNSSRSLRDKSDADTGLVKEYSDSKEVTTRKNLVYIDSRDCVGSQSLEDAQNFFEGRGGRPASSGRIINILDTSPILVTIDTTCEIARLRNGDIIIISDVSKNINGRYSVNNAVGTSFELAGSYKSGAYSGIGIWLRNADPGYPILTENTNYISGNVMNIKLVRRLKLVRTLTMVSSIIPRDIIPLNYYLTDFIDISTEELNTLNGGPLVNNYETYIPQEKMYLETQILGIFSSPLELFRTYINGAYSMPSQGSPFPLKLWNPPIGPNWPLQPQPYPQQTVPTYKSNIFQGPNNEDLYLILSGYGVYDLLDFSIELQISIDVSPFTVDIGPIITDIARKLLLLAIVPKQSLFYYDYVDLIFSSNTVTPGNTVFPYGYGSFQRFIPGPGLQMNYQPGTNPLYPPGAAPTASTIDSPVAFPDFRGNVWGPYSTPGDRFQQAGLRQTLQDLFLNGDLQNLYGDPIIKLDVATPSIMYDKTFGINMNAFRIVTLSNLENTTNINILNAMKINYNGFGTTSLRVNDDGTLYSNTYKNGGGTGPDSLGPPPNGSGWVYNGVEFPSGSGQGDLVDPIAEGPLAGVSTTSIPVNVAPENVDARLSGAEIVPTTPIISARVAWTSDTCGKFVSSVINWKNYLIDDIPETNIVLTIQDAQRDLRVQGTNSKSYSSIFSCPIRFNLDIGGDGSTSYVENLQQLLTDSDTLWGKRFITPLSSIDSLKIEFTTYEGLPIPIEKMLQERNQIDFLRILERIYGGGIPPTEYIWDPLSPTLNRRTKKNISLVFQAETYEYTTPGLLLNTIRNMLDQQDDDTTDAEYIIKASNDYN